MISHSKRYVATILVVLASLVACGTTRPLSISVEQFAIDSLPLPDRWKEQYRGINELVKNDALESWLQTWKPSNSDAWTGLSFGIDEYESINLAKKGYRQSLSRFSDRGFNMVPLPEWQYSSSYADQYTMNCSWPETTGEFCYSVGRYRNFVVILGLDPGDGVVLEQIPELFGTIDQHIQAIIESENDRVVP